MVTLDLQLFEEDMEYICNGHHPGFKVFLHSPGDPPKFWTDSLKLSLDHDVTLYVKPQMTKTSEKLKKYTPER